MILSTASESFTSSGIFGGTAATNSFVCAPGLLVSGVAIERFVASEAAFTVETSSAFARSSPPHPANKGNPPARTARQNVLKRGFIKTSERYDSLDGVSKVVGRDGELNRTDSNLER